MGIPIQLGDLNIKTVTVYGHNLTIEDVHLVAREGAKVKLSASAISAIKRSNSVVKKMDQQKGFMKKVKGFFRRRTNM